MRLYTAGLYQGYEPTWAPRTLWPCPLGPCQAPEVPVASSGGRSREAVGAMPGPMDGSLRLGRPVPVYIVPGLA